MITKVSLFLLSASFFLTNEIAFSQSVRGESIRVHTIPLKREYREKKSGIKRQLVGFLTFKSISDADPETKEAFKVLQEVTEDSVLYLQAKKFSKGTGKANLYTVLWIHKADTVPFTQEETSQDFLSQLKAYIGGGGKLFLTNRAVRYLNLLGLEPVPLKDSIKSCIDDGYGRKLGFHAFREHPLFTGLNGGAYINRPVMDIKTNICGLFGSQVPANGKVVATDWDYIFLREDSKLVFEYTYGKGKVIAVGGYMDFSLPNLNREHLLIFTRNCIQYLDGRLQNQRAFYWNYDLPQVVACPPPLESDLLVKPIPSSEPWTIQSSDLTLKNRFASGNFWDVAGERLLTMGIERGGIEEMWAHPFLAFRDYEVGIRFSYKDTIFWLTDERPEIEVHPSCFSRSYKFPRAYLKEVIVNDPVDPSGVIHYEYRGVYPAELMIRFRSNLRWMWPYSEKVTGSIYHTWDAETGAYMIRDSSGDLNVILGANREPVSHHAGQFGSFSWLTNDSSFSGIPTDKIQVCCLLHYQLEMNDNIDVVFTATPEGIVSARNGFNKAIHDPYRIYRNARDHADGCLKERLMITTPDKDFNTGYRWAVLATDRFFVNTPGMGGALVAGYSTTRKGWDGGHKVNGRPGYGWYFGRDAEWSSFALLDIGDFTKVKSQLMFFNKYQDYTGKIFHEASTSGFIHYDAADATPLYIVLAGKYFRHTYDTAFLRNTWPNIKKAINFCFSTDSDGDHLIENTNVGHGWVEGGELYGSHATLYMAGAWAAALEEASNMAGSLKDYESESYRLEVKMLKGIINNDFWDQNSRFYSYGMNSDRSFRKMPTVLPAVPLYFGVTDPEKSQFCLEQYAGNVFSTNWGVRILRDDSPFFKPTGYHYGSVWPLFTGWTSLAEYHYGNYQQGFMHLMNNLTIYKSWGLGFVEEVLNGARYEPSGVCPHQCWSETMVIQPAIEGLLGLQADAGENRIVLAPHLPAGWDSLSVFNIRLAEKRIDFRYRRQDGLYNYTFILKEGDGVDLIFMPAFPAGTQFTRVMLDGKEIPYTSFKTDRYVTFMAAHKLNGCSELVIETAGGISVLPVIADPRPGDVPEGIRIINSKLSGTEYRIDLEGKQGTSGTFEVYSAMPPGTARNAKFLGSAGKIFLYSVDFEKDGNKYIKKTVILPIQ